MSIKTRDKLVTDSSRAVLEVGFVGKDWATLSIHGQAFNTSDLKELRKFLKKLQRQLEQADLDNSE